MRYILLLIFIFSCSSKRKYIDVLDKPNKVELDKYKRVIPPNGQENRRRYLYYNSLQFKGKIKRD
jgi:hypothetical protein